MMNKIPTFNNNLSGNPNNHNPLGWKDFKNSSVFLKTK